MFRFQGDVESIAMMKPIAANEHEQGFLEYLEDIIGTERFKKPLELLNLKVEELSAMWAEKVTIDSWLCFDTDESFCRKTASKLRRMKSSNWTLRFNKR